MRKYLCLFIMFLHHAYAEDPNKSEASIETLANMQIEELMQVKITSIATGSKKSISESAAIVSVITAEEIESMGATTLEEALESIPGSHISKTELYSPKFQIRGISSKFNAQILFLLNGVPISTINSNNKLGVIPVKMISRIEVIRGPGSALYGTDAVAGVVNVVTKNSSDINGSVVGGRGGSFKTHEAWYLHGATYGELNATLMVSYKETAGHRREITEDAQTRLDRALGTNASLAPGPVNLSERNSAIFIEAEKARWKIRGLIHSLSNVGTGEGTAEALDPKGRYNFNRSSIDLTYHNPKLTEDWDFTSQLTYSQFSQEVERRIFLFPAGSNLGSGVFPDGVSGNPELWLKQFNFFNSGFYAGFLNHKVRLGFGYQYLDLYKVQNSRNSDPLTSAPLPDMRNISDTQFVFLPEKSRWNFYTFIQDEWKIAENWEFTSGARYDRYVDFGDVVNPRVGLVWRTTKDLSTKILYGQAFRAPSFIDLYAKNNLVSLGNPHLNPERTQVYEIAWNYQINPTWSSVLNFFHYKARNIIVYVRDPGGLTATAQNVGVQVGDGAELESRFQLSSNFVFTGNYSFVKATDKVSGKPAGGSPAHKIYARENWIFQKDWNWGTQVNWVGKRKRAPTDNRAPLSGFTSVDMTLARLEILKTLDGRISVHNIFNADIREPSAGPAPGATSVAIPHDLPQAGRSIDVSLAYKF